MPNRGCQAHPGAGAGCCFIQGCCLCWGRGRRCPWQARFLPGHLKGGWPSGPCQTGTFSSAPRSLFSTPLPCLAPCELVSYSCVPTYTYTHIHTTPSLSPAVRTTHHAPLTAHTQYARYTATQHKHHGAHPSSRSRCAVTHCPRPMRRHTRGHNPTPPQASQDTNITPAQHTSGCHSMCTPTYHHMHTLTSQRLAMVTARVPTDTTACSSLVCQPCHPH